MVNLIHNVLYDTNISANANQYYSPDQTVPLTEPHIRLTAVVLDDSGQLQPGQTVYWSSPRIVVEFFDDGGNIVNSSVTDQNGEATINVCCARPALALISASLTPDGNNPYNIHIVFNTITQNGDPNSQVPPIQGPSAIVVPWTSNSWAYSFQISGQQPVPWGDNALVAVWTAQIDYPNTDTSNPFLLGPSTANGNLAPPTWGGLSNGGFLVPYQQMDYNPAAPSNIVQYLVQETYSTPAFVSPWFNFSAIGTPWVQPNPGSPINPQYSAPVILNSRGEEISTPPIITNDFFIFDNSSKLLLLKFHIHIDHLEVGDLILPYAYVNGYQYQTTSQTPISTFFPLGPQYITADLKTGNIVTLEIPAMRISQYSASQYNLGQLYVSYLVNEKVWSAAFSASTSFVPLP
jgi:hypothetical protein